MSTEDLIAYFQEAIESIDNPEAYWLGYVGAHSPSVISRLVCSSFDSGGNLQEANL